jgi:hypothetical protein
MSDDADLPKKLERLKHTYGLEYEMIRATAAFEHATLRPLFILNGGALVAYLALLGAGRIDFPIGRLAVLAWAIGLIAAAVAAFLARSPNSHIASIAAKKSVARRYYSACVKGRQRT